MPSALPWWARAAEVKPVTAARPTACWAGRDVRDLERRLNRHPNCKRGLCNKFIIRSADERSTTLED